MKHALCGLLAATLLSMNACNLQQGSGSAPSSQPNINLRLASGKARLFELPNGLRLIVEEDHSSPVVSVQAWCEAGSLTEGKHLGAGISHILEHMLFKGTTRRGNSEIARTIQDHGGYINAYTSFDRTVYYVDAPSSGWKTLLDVLADAMFHSTLPPEEYAKEQEVIRREFAMGFDDPDRTMQKLFFSTAFTRHPFRYPVIGHLEVYNQLTREDVLAYYKKHYVPNNMTFILVGNVDAEEVKSELTRLTADVPRRAHEPSLYPDEPPQLGRREAAETFPTDARRLSLAWHIPGITHPDIYALDVLAIIAGDGDSSRLHRRLVEREKLLRSVSVFSYTPKDSGLWGVSALFHPGADDLRAKVESEIAEELNKLKTEPVTPSELNKAKRKVLVERASELKTVAGKAAALGSSWLVARDLQFDQTYLEGVQQVTADDLRRVAKTYLLDRTLSVVSLNPPASAPESATAPAANSQTADLQRKVLANGVPLVLKRDEKVPLVNIRVTFLGGILEETAANNGIGTLTSRLLDKGTPTRTAEAIADTIENLGGSVDRLYGNNSLSLGIEVLPGDLDAAVALLADLSLHPSFPAEEFDKERAKQVSDLKLEKDQPTALARNAMRATLFGQHPFRLNPLGSETSLAALTPGALQTYHRSLLHPSRMVFSIGGSFDPAAATALFERYFPKDQLQSGTAFKSPGAPDWTFTQAPLEISTPKQQAIVMIGFPGVSVGSPDRPALEIVNEALSDLASRLFIRIREKQSLAYFVGTGQSVALEPGMFIFYAGTEKTKAEKVRTELLDEIKIMVEKGLAADEIARARAKLTGERLLQDQSAAAIAFKASLNELYGLGLDYESKLNERIQSITDAEINTAIKKYFAPTQGRVTVIVQPK
ncbi:MAG: pitrilysin family protein [Candidatus Methylacidiphilales bacterium]|nr:pitrilysin family protein [Candidatus Methylacidiphilales bacterium]